MHKVIIEARINENAARQHNKNVPWTAAEIGATAKACVEAGASVVHFHPRTSNGGITREYEAYRDIVAAIRDACDVLIHPTLIPFPQDADVDFRLDPIERLANDGLAPDLVPLILATANIDIADESGTFLMDDTIFINTARQTRACVARLQNIGVTPYADVWGIPALRQAEALMRGGHWPKSMYMMFALSNPPMLIGHPGTEKGLRAYLDFLPENVPMHWSPYLVGGNLLALIPQIVKARGHISIGLGDYPYLELGMPTNADVVAEAARLIRGCGGEVATISEARAIIGRSATSPI